ncbi:MAG: phenylalanine--tRNA ligase subunit alpha [Pirellulales bacterium]
MQLDEFTSALDQLAAEAEQAFAAANDSTAFEQARVQFVGARSGQMKTLQKELGSLAGTDKPIGGKKLNEAKQRIQAALDAAATRLESGSAASTAPGVDPTLPGTRRRLGHTHPITQTIEHLKQIMGRLGFEVVEGPEVEDTWHNFVALNIPEDHPARDPLDNFFLSTAQSVSGGFDYTASNARLLRSQTSTVQIRVMEKTQPPVRIISLGRVYRPDEPDMTHFPMFHQMEGLWIDEKVTMAQLKSVLRMFATNYLGSDVTIRFRPSFFPFTEPSVEADFLWNGNWIEFGGAGMVDPNVLKAVGYDPDKVTGFAFGLGVERLCMRRHRVQDIRDLFRNDLRFLEQF